MKALTTILAFLTVCAASPQTIVCPTDAPANVKLAAKEIRRYIYLRTGNLPRIAESSAGFSLKVDPELGPQLFRL